MKKSVIILMTLFLCGSVRAEGTTEHYCDDAKGWAEWVELVQKHPDDDNLRSAYALRLGLCQEVQDGTIETARAVNIFERFMDALRVNVEQEERMQKKSVKEKGV